jgi:hypothetical protein
MTSGRFCSASAANKLHTYRVGCYFDRSMYVESMGRTLQNLFKSYYAQLLKQDLVIATKGDLIAVEEATLKNMFTQKVRQRARGLSFQGPSHYLCCYVGGYVKDQGHLRAGRQRQGAGAGESSNCAVAIRLLLTSLTLCTCAD